MLESRFTSLVITISKRALACALLGLLTSIAVAWSIASSRDANTTEWRHTFLQGFSGSSRTARGSEWVTHLTESDFISTTLPLLGRTGSDSDSKLPSLPLPAWCRDSAPAPIAPLPLSHLSPLNTLSEAAHGWPALCLMTWCDENQRTSIRTLHDAIDTPRAAALRANKYAPRHADVLGVLPLHPIPRGLIIDSAFFGVVWLLPFLAITMLHRAVRRAWRLRKTLCPHCAYPTGATPTCTECGNEPCP